MTVTLPHVVSHAATHIASAERESPGIPYRCTLAVLAAVCLQPPVLAASTGSLVELTRQGREQFEFRPIAGTPCYSKIRVTDGQQQTNLLAPAGTSLSACTPIQPPVGPPVDPQLGEGDFDSEDLRSAPSPSEMFRYGLWHRDSFLVSESSWPVASCVPGGQTQTATRANWSSSFGLCDRRDGNFVLRTAVGDTSGYSIAWFTPKRVFTRSRQPTISWEANLTHLGSRQWWELIIIPAGDTSRTLPRQDQRGEGTDCKVCVTAGWLASVFGGSGYGVQDIVVGNGPFGGSVNLTTGGVNRYSGWRSLHGDYGLLSPAQSAATTELYRFQITDNFNGTLTVDYGGLFTQVIPGSLPESYEVVIKDHNYTPDKDGQGTRGHTWFWDKIRIR